MRRLLKCDVCCKITCLKSLTTVSCCKSFLNIMHFKGSNIFPILLRQNRNCLDGVDYQVVPSFFSIGSLSKGVFARRTSTGSEVFFILKHLDAPKFVFLSVLTIIETSCPKRWAKPLSKNEKRPLPFDVRRSKTSLLKFTIILE